jgi:hypothetical protein
MELQLLLKFKDQASRGLNAALRGSQRETKNLTRDINALASAANKIKPTAIERMTTALRRMQSAARGGFDVVNRATQAGASIAAGGYVLNRAATRPMAYDRRLALLANTGFNDRGVDGRIAAKAEISAGVRRAVRYGGTPEQALDTLNTLVGSGAMGDGRQGVKSSLRLLPTIQKYATGSGASANDLASLVVSLKQTMGIKDADIPTALSKAIRAGQEGGFELTDMARWLPQQMALYSANGAKGMGGFESLLAANQVARITAGTTDEAGNNLVNLLTKLNSQDTVKDFQKQGINLTGSLAAAREKGILPLDAFVKLVDNVSSRDQRFQDLKSKAAGETGADRKVTLEAMTDLLMQSGVGKVIQDRQAMGALLALMQQRGKYNDVLQKVGQETGNEGMASFATVADSADFRKEQLENRSAFAAQDSLNAVDKPLKSLLDGVVAAADKFPGLAAGAWSATTALVALAAAAGAGGLVSLLRKSGGAVPSAAAAGSPSLMRQMGIPAASAVAGGAGGSLLRAIPGVGMALGAVYATYENEKASRENFSQAVERAKQRINAEQKIKVDVDVKNGNITASVNEQNSRQGTRR